ncbi:MAG: hypothetical protein JWQ40_2006 [Segetibacter sp.]|jgi:hypothetical protein|nr:hypothetical protein [Segetibacter sp.]
MQKSTHDFQLSEKLTYAIIALGVLAYIIFVIYLEMNDLA